MTQYTAGARCTNGHVWVGVSNQSQADAQNQARAAAASCAVCMKDWADQAGSE